MSHSTQITAMTPDRPGDILRATLPAIEEIMNLEEDMDDIKRLPAAFDVVHRSFNDIKVTLKRAPDRLDKAAEGERPEIASITRSWAGKIASILVVLKEIKSSAEGTNKNWAQLLSGYSVTVTKLGEGGRVEELMKTALKDFLKLKPYGAVGDDPDKHVAKFEAAITALSDVAPSDADLDAPSHNFTQNISNGGRGWQNNNFGANQHAAFGGPQFNISGSGTHNYVTNSTDALVQERKHENRIALIKSLYACPYDRRKDLNPHIVRGTCEWFKQHRQFKQWSTTSSSTILWVSANPGCGKSVLARHLVDDVIPHSTNTKDAIVSYFFFKDNFADQRSAKIAIGCILHQIFKRDIGLLSDAVMDRFNIRGGYEKSSLRDLWDILIMALTPRGNVKKLPTVVCVLDALDECETNERSELADILCNFHRRHDDVLASSNHPMHLKFIVTSRPYKSIRQMFQTLISSPGGHFIHLTGEADDEVNAISSEIELFIRSRIRQISERHGLSPGESLLLLENVLSIPNRTYLWVYLTLDLVNRDFNENMDLVAVVRRLPDSVDAAYEALLAKSTDPVMTKTLLQIVIAAAHPLTLELMNIFLFIKQDSRTLSSIRLVPESRLLGYIRELCGLFVTTVGRRIYLLHQTAQPFLLGQGGDNEPNQAGGSQSTIRLWKSSLSLKESHQVLLLKTTVYLHLTDVRMTRMIRNPGLHLPNDIGLVKLDSRMCLLGRQNEYRPRLFLYYAAKYWLYHLRLSGNDSNTAFIQSLLRSNNSGGESTWWFQHLFHYQMSYTPFGFTNLSILSFLGLHRQVRVEIAQTLDDINAKDTGFGRSALLWATYGGHIEVVRIFLAVYETRKGMASNDNRTIDLNLRDIEGNTALHLAAQESRESIATLLLAAGANANIKNNYGYTPSERGARWRSI